MHCLRRGYPVSFMRLGICLYFYSSGLRYDEFLCCQRYIAPVQGSVPHSKGGSLSAGKLSAKRFISSHLEVLSIS